VAVGTPNTPRTGWPRPPVRFVALLLLPALLALGAVTGCSDGSGTSGDSGASGGVDTSAVPTSRRPGTGSSSPSAAPATSGFLAFGDFGTADKSQRAVARAMIDWAAAPGHRTDALVTTGDNVYPDGASARFPATLDEPYARLRRLAPMWAALGNHDVAGGNGGAELRHLGLPTPPYSKRLPGVELLFLDANHVDDAQARWVRARLAAPGPPFRVVVFHQPAWSCSHHGSTAAVDRRWVPIFERYRVALVLNGHDHNYQRYTSGRGVTYVVTGGGGAALYPVHDGCDETPPRDAAISRHHFTAIQVAGRAMTLTAIGTNGGVFDRVVIRR
jgi:calcineurin-like phosphoesterase family protein